MLDRFTDISAPAALIAVAAVGLVIACYIRWEARRAIPPPRSFGDAASNVRRLPQRRPYDQDAEGHR